MVFFQARSNSAQDASNIAVGLDVGATNVFRPIIGEQKLTFEAADGSFMDNETGTTWNLLGEGLAGLLAGEQLA